MALERSYQDLVAPEGCGMMTKSCLKNWESVVAADPHVEDEEPSGGGFDCNICLDTVQDPVVTLCGHLYCWPCIYRWLQVQGTSPEPDAPTQPQCPVCKAEVSQETLVPLYGRGGSTKSSKSKARNLDIVVPRRPFSTTCRVDSPRSIGSRRSLHDHPPLSQQHPIYDDSHLEIPPTVGMIGVLARAFGGSPCIHRNSYNLVGMSSPRVRRHLMETDKSLGRISFFLLCCFVLCLLLF
ncbi:hypothetical protein MLD38_003094 [Melastoma candidum]|nr:hypothetical protein MLD38_003094 [Melastoma candidum]